MSRWFVSTLKYGGLVLAVVAAVALVHNQVVANVSSNVVTAGYSVFLIIGVLCVLAGANWERRFPPASESAAGEPANPTNKRQHIGDAGLARAADTYSARIKQILGMIETVEKSLREKRKRIEEIQVRHEDLALKYRQLGQSLDSATTDLAQQFADVGDLGSDVAIAKLLAGAAPAPVAASNMAAEPPDLPPVCERVRKAQGTPIHNPQDVHVSIPSIPGMSPGARGDPRYPQPTTNVRADTDPDRADPVQPRRAPRPPSDFWHSFPAPD